MPKGIIFYILSGVLIITDLICISIAQKKPTHKEKMSGKEIPLTGKGSKAHLIYLGVVFIVFGIVVLFRK